METPGAPNRYTKLEHASDASTPVGGHLRYDPVHIKNIPKKSDSTPGHKFVDFTWPYDVDLLAGYYYGTVRELDGQDGVDYGDEVAVYSPVGVVGIVVIPASPGATTIVVGAAWQYVDRGDFVLIGTDGKKREVLEVIPGQLNDQGQEVAPGQLKLVEPLDVGFSQNDPVNMFRYFVGRPDQPMPVTPRMRQHEWGRDTTTAARIYAGKALRIEYWNSSTETTKALLGTFAILY